MNKNGMVVINLASSRLENFEYVSKICSLKKNKYFGFSPFSPLTFSHGLPGFSVLFAYISVSQNSSKWERNLDNCLTKMAKLLHMQGLKNLSFFSGLSGIAASVATVSKLTGFYSSLSRELFSQLISHLNENFFSDLDRSFETFFPSQDSYDLVNGISGIINSLLHYKFHCSDIICRLASFIVDLDKEVFFHGIKLPRWMLLKSEYEISRKKPLKSLGCFDSGYAHGLAGILAVLSKVKIAGIKVVGLSKFLDKWSDWLLNKKIITSKGNIWLPFYSLSENKFRNFYFSDHSVFNHRDAWCYGSPGVARSIYLAGKALNNKFFFNESIKAMTHIANRVFYNQTGLQNIGFCHGISGLSSILYLMWKDTNIPLFHHAAQVCNSQIIDSFNPFLPFGWQFDVPEHNNKLDLPGILEGSCGTILTLLQSYSNSGTGWLDFFLL